MRFPVLPFVLAFTVTGLSAPAGSATLTKIADSSSLAADGSTMRSFGTPQIAGTTVIFGAQSQNGLTALYSAPAAGGTLIDLVDTNTPVPDGIGNFTPSNRGFASPFQGGNCNAPVAGTKSAAFTGSDAAGSFGVYSVPLAGGKVVKLADYSTTIPGGPLPGTGDVKFNADDRPCDVAISGARVVFDTQGGDGNGVYSVLTNGKALSRVADPNTPQQAPGPFPKVNAYTQPTILGSTAAYIGGTTGGPFGIYAGGTSSVGGPVISDANSEGSPFDQFKYPSLGGRIILFEASVNGSTFSNALATVNLAGTGAKVIFNVTTSAVPTGALGTKFQQVGTDTYNFLGNDGVRQVFTAETYDAPPATYNFYDGAFSYCRGKLSKIIQTGDPVGTLQIRAVNGISNLQRVTVGGVVVDEFAAEITLGPSGGTPSTYDGAPAIYVVSVPTC